MLRVTRFSAWSLLVLVVRVGGAATAGLAGCSSSSSVTPDLDGGSVDGGGGSDASADAGTANVCTSGKTWTNGDIGSQLMRPGETCIACHTQRGGKAPAFKVAGTVYPTRHEPNDCNGLAAVTVTIIDANGMETKLTPNAAGSFACGPKAGVFTTTCDPVFPISARINTADGKTATMVDPQMTGDCNSCHTEQGVNNSPGRISPP